MPDTLRGRRILITRARAQASLLAVELEQRGAIPILIPAIEIAPPLSFTPLDHALSSVEDFEWLLFTSANAVHAFAQRSFTLGQSPRPKRIAAIGPSTAQALALAGIEPRLSPLLLPPTAVAESLADALVAPIHSLLRANLQPRLALIRAETARDILPEALAAAGAIVDIIPAYRTVLPSTSIAALQSVLTDSTVAPEAATFTSSSTVMNLQALLHAANVELPPNLLRVSIGPITSATLRELAMPPHAEAAEPNIPSLIEALTQAFNHQKERFIPM